MNTPSDRKETELAARVVSWLESLDWEVHKEVQLQRGTSRADIVAVTPRLTWVVETKTVFGLAIMEQAVRWLPFANFVSIATPWARGGQFREDILRHFGLGWMTVGTELQVRVAPAMRRRTGVWLRDALNEGTRTWAEAGNANHQYWSPFRQTCREVLAVVSAHPGIGTKQLFDAVAHHYSSDKTARSCMLRWAQNGKIKGVEVRTTGGGKAEWWPLVDRPEEGPC